MPTKKLTSPFDKDGLQKIFKFGGGDDVIFTENNDANGIPFTSGYWIETRGGDDVIYGSDILSDPMIGNRDVLIGGDGSDTIFGGGGSDSIVGGNIGGADKSKGNSPPPTNLLIGDGVRQSDGSYIGSITIGGVAVTNGSDGIVGGDGSTNDIYGDFIGVTLDPNAVYTTGDDGLLGGSSSDSFGAVNRLFGDTADLTMGSFSIFNAGADDLTAGAGNELFLTQNTLYGDIANTLTMPLAQQFNGARDALRGGTDANTTMYGDAFDVTVGFSSRFTGGDDLFTGSLRTGPIDIQNTMIGDANLVEFSHSTGAFIGGNDSVVVFVAGDGADYTMVGDANFVSGNGEFVGGADALTGGFFGSNMMVGDVVLVTDGGTVLGGVDMMTGGNDATNTMYGDFDTIAAGSVPAGAFITGGDDVMRGGDDGTNTMSGDAARIESDDTFIGGDDQMFGGLNATNRMYGDVQIVSGALFVDGGDDTLIGVIGNGNFMHGDFEFVANNSDPASIISGGNDTLIGAAGTMDVMYGDWFLTLNTGVGTFITGADRFDIRPNGGLDAIMDFESGKDQVDLSAFGLLLDTNGSGTFEFDDLDPLWANLDGDLALDFDGDGDLSDDVLLFDRIVFNPDPDAPDFGLADGDFIFA